MSKAPVSKEGPAKKLSPEKQAAIGRHIQALMQGAFDMTILVATDPACMKCKCPVCEAVRGQSEHVRKVMNAQREIDSPRQVNPVT